MVNALVILQVLPLVGALLIWLLPKDKVRLGAWLAMIFALAQFAFTLALLPNWSLVQAPFLGMVLSFVFDPLTATALLVISGATALAALYSLRSADAPSTPARSVSFYALFLLVLFGTTGVAMARDLIQFYLFWEAMLIPAWFLVVLWNEDPAKVKATGLKFFIITHIGAVLMLASILWIYSLAGTTQMGALAAFLPTLPLSTLIPMALLFLMGFIVKMAIFPFHTWLPDAYTTAAMPVTLVLVAVLTNIGIYGFARFLPFFPLQAVQALSLPLLIAAVVTMFYGGIQALVEKNAKRVVAYSSISQMGYVLFGLATITTQGFSGSILNLYNQAATKLALFMALGMVAEAAGTWQIDQLGGWAKRLPFAAVVGVVALLSLVGMPPAFGFWPEFLTFSGGFAAGQVLLSILALVASVLSVAYGLRLIRLVFYDP
jgi:NADH-quinone oxidoreductase subunit M